MPAERPKERPELREQAPGVQHAADGDGDAQGVQEIGGGPLRLQETHQDQRQRHIFSPVAEAALGALQFLAAAGAELDTGAHRAGA